MFLGQQARSFGLKIREENIWEIGENIWFVRYGPSPNITG